MLSNKEDQIRNRRAVQLEHSTCKEVANGSRNLLRMSFKREVARVEKTNRRSWNVAFESLGPCWQEKRIVLAPRRKEQRFLFAEVLLEGRIERDVALVIAEEVQLNFVGAGTGEIKVVERIAVRRNGGHVSDAVRVLPECCLRFQKGTYRVAVGLRRILPIFLNGIPTFTQSFFISVTVLEIIAVMRSG